MPMAKKLRSLHARIPAAPARIVLCAALLISAVGALATPFDVRAQGTPPVFDIASSTGTVIAIASSLTWSHTVTSTGADRILVVGVSIRNGSSQTVSSVTYNGVAFPPVLGGVATNGTVLRNELWYLLNPATGTNNVVVTLS